MYLVLYFEAAGFWDFDDVHDIIPTDLGLEVDPQVGGVTLLHDSDITRGVVVLKGFQDHDISSILTRISTDLNALVCEIECVDNLGPGFVLVDRPGFYLALSNAT